MASLSVQEATLANDFVSLPIIVSDYDALLVKSTPHSKTKPTRPRVDVQSSSASSPSPSINASPSDKGSSLASEQNWSTGFNDFVDGLWSHMTNGMKSKLREAKNCGGFGMRMRGCWIDFKTQRGASQQIPSSGWVAKSHIWDIVYNVHPLHYHIQPLPRGCQALTAHPSSSHLTHLPPQTRLHQQLIILRIPNSATPSFSLISAIISNRPSESRTSILRGESPQRTMMDVGVLDTTSKWSVIRVPSGYSASFRSFRSQRSVAVSGPRYFFSRYRRCLPCPFSDLSASSNSGLILSSGTLRVQISCVTGALLGLKRA
ncbi:hypothetical protein KC352_g25 [Hortaea werneckii]|nr:hypothetical protein KC352_g25 [Hortaea werneckii]